VETTGSITSTPRKSAPKESGATKWKRKVLEQKQGRADYIGLWVAIRSSLNAGLINRRRTSWEKLELFAGTCNSGHLFVDIDRRQGPVPLRLVSNVLCVSRSMYIPHLLLEVCRTALIYLKVGIRNQPKSVDMQSSG